MQVTELTAAHLGRVIKVKQVHREVVGMLASIKFEAERIESQPQAAAA